VLAIAWGMSDWGGKLQPCGKENLYRPTYIFYPWERKRRAGEEGGAL